MTAGAAVVRYAGEGATLLRAPGWTLLLALDPADPLVARCWDLLQVADDPDDVLDVVLARGLRSTGAFALVREGSAGRLVARGDVVVLIDGEDVTVGRPAGAWLDLPAVDASSLEVHLAGAPRADWAGLPLRDGAAVASAFVTSTNEAGTGAGPGHLVRAGTDADLRHPVDADRSTPEPDVAAQDFSQLFAETHAPRAGIAPADPDATAPRPDTRLTTFTSGRVQPDGPAAPPTTESHEMFVSREQLMRGSDTIEAPLVLSATCPAGHLTSAYGSYCRVCRLPVADQDFFETLRPPLGRLVLPQGDVVLLDRGAVLGRSPWVPADWAGAQPHLVALNDPDHDISAQHVSLSLDQWNILVTDQGSTNGTTVIDPRGVERRLRPHEVQEVEPGSTIVLAEVLALLLEVES